MKPVFFLCMVSPLRFNSIRSNSIVFLIAPGGVTFSSVLRLHTACSGNWSLCKLCRFREF
jgi:hypothetical protein